MTRQRQYPNLGNKAATPALRFLASECFKWTLIFSVLTVAGLIFIARSGLGEKVPEAYDTQLTLAYAGITFFSSIFGILHFSLKRGIAKNKIALKHGISFQQLRNAFYQKFVVYNIVLAVIGLVVNYFSPIRDMVVFLTEEAHFDSFRIAGVWLIIQLTMFMWIFGYYYRTLFTVPDAESENPQPYTIR